MFRYGELPLELCGLHLGARGVLREDLVRQQRNLRFGRLVLRHLDVRVVS